MGEYFHEFDKEADGEGGLALFDCTVVESTMYFSILDCLLAKSSAPFPRKAGISKAEPKPESDMILLGGVGDDTFAPLVYEFIRRGGVGWVF